MARLIREYMKIQIVLFSLLSAIQIITARAQTDSSATLQSNVPITSWTSEPGGIDLAVILFAKTEQNSFRGAINIYIKNTWDTPRRFFPHGRDAGIRISYLGDTGTLVPLHDYTHDDDVLYSAGPITIKPGETVLRTIKVTGAELVILKSHRVCCAFGVYDPSDQKSYKIESVPVTLAVISQ
jgi:hypothetical protein